MELSKREKMKSAFYDAVLFGLEILFGFGIASILAGLYIGVIGGYVTLFSMMVISGAIFGYVLVNLMKREDEKTESLRFGKVLIRILILSAVGFAFDYRAGIALLAGNLFASGVHYYAKKHVYDSAYSILCIYTLILESIFFYQGASQGWFSLSAVITLLYGEMILAIQMYRLRFHVYTEVGEKRGLELLSLLQHGEYEKKDILVLSFLKTLAYGILCVIAGITVPAMMHALKEGSLYDSSRINAWLFALAAAELVLLALAKKKKESMRRVDDEDVTLFHLHSTIIPNAIALLECIIGSALLIMRASALLAGVMLLSEVAVYAIWFMALNSSHTSALFLRSVRWVGMHLAVCAALAAAIVSYNGIFVDFSVVFMTGVLMLTHTAIFHLEDDGDDSFDVLLSVKESGEEE